MWKKRTYSCSNFVAISSLVLELLKKCRVRWRVGHPVYVFLFLPPWRWSHESPKHICDHDKIKLHPYNQSEFVGILIYFRHLINARDMENSKLLTFQSPAATPVCVNYRNIQRPPHFGQTVYLRSVRCSHQTQIISPVNINGLFSGEQTLCARRCTNRSYNF
jgi:hypothetical protein